MAASFSDDLTSSPNRIAPRHTFDARIQIRLERGNQKVNLQGWARDLSESGLGAFVADSLMLGESVTLEIPLPGSDKLIIPAIVIRAVGTEYGFRFTALSAEQRRQMRAAVKGRPTIPYPGSGQ